MVADQQLAEYCHQADLGPYLERERDYSSELSFQQKSAKIAV